MSIAAHRVNEASTLFQKFFIPANSIWVRRAMKHAALYSQEEGFFYSRCVPVSLAIVAVAFSAINALSYLLQAPVRILLNITCLNPIALVEDMLEDLWSFARSLVFVSLGVTFVAAGLLFPVPIFAYFAPDSSEPYEVRLEIENKDLREKNAYLEQELDQMKEKMVEVSALLEEGAGQKWSWFTPLLLPFHLLKALKQRILG
jgi:hypothetical protein